MNLVIGASGTLGSRIAQRLLDKEMHVKAVSRRPEKLSMLASKGAEVIRGDLRDTSWMDGALQNVKCLFLAAHGLVPPSRSNSIDKVDDAGNRNIIDAAQRAGVGRIFFTSAYLAKPHTLIKFGRIKHKIEEYVKTSGLNYTIVRAGAFIEIHALLLIGEPLRQSGKVKFFGKGQTPTRWISAADVADYMVERVDDPDAYNTVKKIGGPDILSRVQVLDMIEHLMGKKAQRSHVPVGVLRTMKVLSKAFNPGLGYLIEATLAEDSPSDPDDWVPSDLDWIAPTTVEQAVLRWLGHKE
jgi:uncharacterized protein YbjT (DUF2867 family)